MKKGDLVRRRHDPDNEEYYVPEFETAVLLSDPYATVFTHVSENGEPIYSIEKIVVDLLVNNEVCTKCPTSFIVKVNSVI
mgnify:CR=1 FL=1